MDQAAGSRGLHAFGGVHAHQVQGAAEDDLGFACYGTGPCSGGEPGNNRAIALSTADVARVEGIVADVVLRRCAERCGTDCAKVWNDTVGAALGVKAGE